MSIPTISKGQAKIFPKIGVFLSKHTPETNENINSIKSLTVYPSSAS
jgi:hypothetical protein